MKFIIKFLMGAKCLKPVSKPPRHILEPNEPSEHFSELLHEDSLVRDPEKKRKKSQVLLDLQSQEHLPTEEIDEEESFLQPTKV